jgi:hypothetical protein
MLLGIATLTPMERFQALLSNIALDSKVIDRIASSPWLSSRLNSLVTQQHAEKLYDDASRIPQTETRAEVLREINVVIDGDIVFPGVQTAIFLHAFENGLPKVLKIPHEQTKASLECKLYEELGYLAEKSCIALVPIRRLNLQGSSQRNHSVKKELSFGILMPHYCCTLGNVPSPIDGNDAEATFTRIIAAIRFIHSHKWMHGDIKPSNIFVEQNGIKWLGDFGSSVGYNNLHNFTGGTPMYQCSDVKHVDDPLKFDCVGLVLSILDKLNVQLPRIPQSLLDIIKTIEELHVMSHALKNICLVICTISGTDLNPRLEVSFNLLLALFLLSSSLY